MVGIEQMDAQTWTKWCTALDNPMLKHGQNDVEHVYGISTENFIILLANFPLNFPQPLCFWFTISASASLITFNRHLIHEVFN
jgi:hypothetical protein